MKIYHKTNKQVEIVTEMCRAKIVSSIIELLKAIGVQSGQDYRLGKTLFLFKHQGNTTQTILVNQIGWAEGKPDYFIASMSGKNPTSDWFLSLSNLETIYVEVEHIARKAI